MAYSSTPTFFFIFSVATISRVDFNKVLKLSTLSCTLGKPLKDRGACRISVIKDSDVNGLKTIFFGM